MLVARLMFFIPLVTVIIVMGVIGAMESRPKYRVLSFILGALSLALPMAIIISFLFLSSPAVGLEWIFLTLVAALSIESAILSLLFKLQ